MSLNLSTASAKAALNGTGFKEQFDAGFLYLFAGTAPATADEALNMATTHTQVAKISVGGDGVTGLTFDAPTTASLAKAAAETWSGLTTFDGFESGEASLTPTFYRFCTAADTGRTAADTSTGYRVQGSIGGAGSGADLEMGSLPVGSGLSQSISTFAWELAGA